MAALGFRKLRFGEVATVLTATVETLVSLLPAAVQGLRGVHRLTVHNISDNNIEIAPKTSADEAPVTGSMDVLEPGDSISFEMEGADLKGLYVKADNADSKVFVWGEGK